LLGGSALGPATTTGDRMPGHVLGANLAEVGLLRAATRIGVRQTKRSSLTFVDLFAAAITYKDGFSSHEILLLKLNNAFIVAKTSKMQYLSLHLKKKASLLSQSESHAHRKTNRQ
jgi:hypothetical protein